MKVLISEVIWNEGIEELKLQGFEVEYQENLWADRKRLISTIVDFDALIVRNQTQVDEELLSAGKNLQVIGRLGVGLDNIDIPAAKSSGAKVVFAKNANATSVAEYVISAILNSNRSLTEASEDVQKGNWDRRTHTGLEINGKTLGLIGLGEISHRVAKRAQAFGMNVVGYDPFITEYDHVVAETGVTVKPTIEELLRLSDFVSIHVPLNDSTRYLIGKDALRLMKKSAYLINTSRGGIVDEESLATALEEKQIAGTFLDVLEKEPVDPGNRLMAYPNAVLTPHIAGITNESQIRTSILVAKEVTKILKGSPSLCVV